LHSDSSDSQHLNELCPYVRILADCLALRDWSFAFGALPAPAPYQAQITPLRGRKHAEIRLCEGFFILAGAVQRRCLVHELLHCHLAPCGFVAQDALGPNFQGVFVLNLEYGVDGLADAIAPLLPLPPSRDGGPLENTLGEENAARSSNL